MTHGFESIRRRFFFGPVALLEEIDGQQNMMDGLRFRKWMAERLQIVILGIKKFNIALKHTSDPEAPILFKGDPLI